MSPAALPDETRRILDQVSWTLQSPTAPKLEAALTLLHDAHSQWQSVTTPFGTPHSAVPELRRQLTDCRNLAEQAAVLYLGLAAVVLAASGAYTAAGQAVPLTDCRQVSVEG